MGQARSFLFAFLLAALGGASAVSAQQRPHDPEPNRPDAPNRRPNQDRAGTARPDDSKPQRPLAGQRPGDAKRNPQTMPGRAGGLGFMGGEDLSFHILEADRRPLAPGEDEELLNFARAEIPRVYKLLERIRNGRPAEFRQRLEEAAPRLRYLRRIFTENRDIGRLFVRRAENEQDINQMRRTWRQSADKPVQRQRIEAELRRRLAENLRLENQIMEMRLGQLRETRAQRVQNELQRLTGTGADLTAETPTVRQLATDFQAASEPEEKRKIRAQLQDTVGQQLDNEAAALRERMEQFKRERPEERLERRLRRLLDFGPPSGSERGGGAPAEP